MRNLDRFVVVWILLMAFTAGGAMLWVAQPPAMPQTLTSVEHSSPPVEQAMRVVRLRGRTHGCGSGFPVARVGGKILILTAKHVTSALDDGFTVETWDGIQLPVVSKTFESPDQDVALVWVEGDLEPLAIGEMHVGDKVMASGFPLNEGLHLSEGYVGGITFGMQEMGAEILFGMSGGPVVNERGEVVGMNKGVCMFQNQPLPMISLMLPLFPIRDWIGKTLGESLPR